MNKLRKKILIAFFTLILIAGVGCAIWSYRNAFAEDNRVTEFDSVDMDSRPAGFTNIDYIIQNARDTSLTPDPVTGYDESVYHIVEISSGSLSLLDKFSVLNETDLTNADTNDDYAAFRRVVLTLNRSSAQPNEMPFDKIEYIGFSTADLNTSDTRKSEAVQAISNADFLYLSIDPNSVYDTHAGTDIPADIKTALNRYAATLKKPIIIDSPTKTKQDQGESISTFATLGKTYYENGSSYNTFFWGPKNTADPLYTTTQLFDRTSGSVFMPINGTLVRGNWVNTYEQVTDTNGSYAYRLYDGPNPQNANPYNVARILSITASSTDATPFADSLKYKADGTPITPEVVQIIEGTPTDAINAADGQPIVDANGRQAYTNTLVNKDAYKIDADNPLNNAYKTYQEHPDYVIFDKIKYDKDTTTLSLSELSKYDIVILEDSLKSSPISDGTGSDKSKNDLMLLISLMYSNQHIIYSREMIPSGGNSNRERYDADNFNYIYDLLVSDTDTRRYDSVLVSSRKEMNETYANKNADGNTEAPIAYIINKGAYRPSGSGEDSSDKFRVLEIQPCYPVDLPLAAQIAKIDSLKPTGFESNYFGNTKTGESYYFFDQDNIKNNIKGENEGADEITFDGVTSLSAMKDASGNFTTAGLQIIANNPTGVKSYYAWELTPAKILHVLEQTTEFATFPASKIEVIHMSSNQFQSSRLSLVDNYDMIYIGGDNSGIKELEYFYANSSGKDSQGALSNLGVNNATYYNMYYHNGDLYNYKDVVKVGYEANGYGILYGNDITYDKLEELKEYVDAGMPVVISSQLTTAYKDVLSRRTAGTEYKQHVLDPDSNIVKFLDTYYDNKPGEGTKSNIIFDFNSKDTVRIQNLTKTGDKYSRDAISGVTVFGGDEVEDINGNLYTSASTVSEKDLVNLIEHSKFRPKFKMTRFPNPYDGSDATTKKTSALHSRTLSYAFDMITQPDDVTFYLYIDDNADSKFEEGEIVTSCDATTGKFTYTVDDDFSGALYLQVTAKHKDGTKSSWRQICKIDPEGAKEQIDLLQILPENMYSNVGTTTDITLYFCTECQMSGYPFRGNHYAEHGKYQTDVLRAKQGIDGFSESIMPSNSGLSAPTAVVNGITRRDPNTKVTAGDNEYSYEGNLLGIHVHQFGIFDYASHGECNPDLDPCGTDKGHGMDDITDNLADEIEDDYDFNVNIMSTREFEKMIGDVETMYASATSVTTLRDQYSAQRSKYEAFYKEMNMLITEDVQYVPAGLYDFRRRVNGISGAGAADINDLRDDLRAYYPTIGLTEPSGAASMSPEALYNDINTRLGISSTSYDELSKMLEKYDLTITDHINFEREMLLLGSSVENLGIYTRAQQNMNGYCDKLINYIDNGGTFSQGFRDDTNKAHLRDELVYWKTHYNYYDFYSLTATETGKGPTLDGDTDKVTVEFGKYYSPWRDAMIYKKYFYDKYMEAKVKAAVDDTGLSLLTNVYSIIILGPANHFGFDDFNDTATACIKRYADNEGKVLLYHDTIDSARLGRATKDFSYNIAADLRETFGMDARHLVKTSTDKTLISGRSITATFEDKTYELSINNEADKNYLYSLSVNPPSSSSKTRVYVCKSAPQTEEYEYSYPNKVTAYHIGDTNNYGELSPSGGFASNVSAVRGTLRYNGEGLFNASDSTIALDTTNNTSTINFNFNAQKWNYYIPSLNRADYEDYNTTIYLLVCSSENEPYISQGRVLAKNCQVVKLTSGESATVSIGVPTLTSVGSRNDGTISGFTTEANKQKLRFSIRTDDLSLVVGKKITFTDTANGLNETVIFGSGTYGSEAVAQATIEFDNWSIPAGGSISFVPTGGRSADKYYLSPLATDGSNKLDSNLNPVTTAITSRVTSSGGTGYINGEMNKHMYRYGAYDVKAEDYFNSTQTRQDCLHDFKTKGKRAVDDKIGNNNSGLLTSYPFSLPNDFTVTSTHPQAFDLDVEDSSMIVYYSFVAGSQGTQSQMHAANPYDGTENYFIYQYNSVTYCGAGHMNVTGFGTDNREERMLYINVIVNSLHKSAIGTQVKLYDENATNEKIENGTANAVIKPDGLGNYTLEVKDSTVTPAFSVKTLVDTNEHVTRVRAWYDLDLESEQINHPFEDPDGVITYDHKLFYDTNGGKYDKDGDGVEDTIPVAEASELALFTVEPQNINKDAKFIVGDMKLKQEYFDAYDGMHTYIVVCVTTERKGKVYNTYRKIRINLKPYMFDLT